MLLFLALACGGPDADSGDTGDTADTTDTASDTGDPADTSETDTGDTSATDTADTADTADTDCTATEEDCATAVDDDCDGVSNERGGLNCATFYEDADEDGFGSGEGACFCASTLTYSAAMGGDCDDADPARAESCAMPEAVVIRNAYADDNVVDVDGDGIPELGVATRADSGAIAGGALVTIPTADADVTDLALVWTPEWPRVADVTGDGAVDLFWMTSDNTTFDDDYDWHSRYTVSYQPGPLPMEAGTAAASASTGWFDRDDDEAALLAAGGDLDGNGVDDAIVMAGSAVADSNGWLFDAADVAGVFSRAPAVEMTGRAESLSSPGDIDGDGFDDLVAVEGGSGVVHVWYGPLAPEAAARADVELWPAERLLDAGDADGDGLLDLVVEGLPGFGRGVRLYRSPLSDYAAEAVVIETLVDDAGLADVDGDGSANLLIGLSDDVTGEWAYGGVFVFGALADGTYTLADAVRRVTGERDGDWFGAGIVRLPDLGGDGADDVAVSSGEHVYVFPAL